MYPRANMICETFVLTLLTQNMHVKAQSTESSSFNNEQDFTADTNLIASTSLDMLETSSPPDDHRSSEITHSIEASTSMFSKDGFQGTTFSRQIDELYDKDQCYVFGLCTWRSGLISPELRFCHCDQDCLIYNDCCIDVEFDRDPKKELPYRACVVSRQKPKAPIQATGIIVIDRCPDHYHDKSILQNCFRNLTQAGPFVVDENGTIYKNRYCAECHGIFSYVFYSIKIIAVDPEHLNSKYDNLNQMERLELYLSYPDVDYNFIPPNGTEQRRCVVYEDSFYENETAECKDYGVNPFITMHSSGALHLYRNVFCNRHEGYTFSTCYGRIIREPMEIFALTAMFSFSSFFKECNEDEEKVNGICVSLPKHTNALRDVVFRLESTEPIELTFLRRLIYCVEATVSTQDSMIHEISCFDESSSVNGTLMYCHLYVRFFKELTTREAAKLFKQFKNFKWEGRVFLETNNTTHIFIEQDDDQEVVNLDDIYATRAIVDTVKPGVQGNDVAVARQKFITGMNFHNVFQNATSMLCFNLFVQIIQVDQKLFIEEIKCLNSAISATFKSNEYLKAVFTYVGCSLSFFALLVSLVVSRKLKLYKSIPGNNLENLSVSLAMSNLLFMFGIGANNLQVVCYVLGISLHYLWLVSFSFMTLTVTFLCYSLLKMASITSSKQSKLKMTFAGLFLPLLMVCPAVILDLLDIPMFKAMYAGSICFPTGTMTNLVFFSGPIIMCLLVNIVTVVILVCSISRHNIKMNQVRRSQTFLQAEVYVRVCLLSGLTWCLAIIGAALDSDYVDFITVVLCSLQGLGVALGNLTTKQVFRSVGEWRNSYTHNAKTTKSATDVEEKF